MSGGNPAHAVRADGPGPPYRVAWTADLEGGAAAGPVTTDEAAIVVGKDSVTALSLATGAEMWTAPRSEGATGSPAVAGGLVVFAVGTGDDAAIVAVTAEDGQEAWRTSVPAAVLAGLTAVAVAGEAEGTVYAASRDGVVAALDLATGEERWTYEAGTAVEGTPAVAEDLVIVVAQSTTARTATVHAVDADTGRKAWTRAGLTASASAVAVAGGQAFVGTGDGRVRALDAATGDLRWETRVRYSFSPESVPAVTDDLYVGDLFGHLYRLDPSDGAERWVFRVPGDLLRGTSVPVDRWVVAGDASGQVSAIDARSGHLVWRHDLGAGRVLAPAPGGSVLVTAVAGGDVTAFETDPGADLLDEPSPTTLFVDRALVSYAAVAGPLFLVLLVVFRLTWRRERA